jgi:bifunctional non-homologous end joining protein LigD
MGLPQPSPGGTTTTDTMGLELYRKKRNFKTTPEPEGRVHARASRDPVFVIQKHAASHLHYDFRLEHNGVLLSWAVPKGPSLDPRDKRLAMHVEDHPIEYGDFEGVIPPKQYGSGTVLLWDRGTWEPQGDVDAGYRQGKLKFVLHGEKLHGGWMLVKSHGGKYDGEKSWLLIKENDEYARTGPDGHVVETEPDSVASGRSLEAIAADPEREWHSNKSVAENVKSGRIARRKLSLDLAKVKGARKAAQPDAIEAELATLVDRAPTGDEWVHEIKFDGYRMLSRLAAGECTIVSRNGKEWTNVFPTIAHAIARLPVKSAWLDGEIVVVDENGRTSFQALQNVLSEGRAAKVVYYVFDLPYADGYDLRDVPLVERKKLLAKIVGEGTLIRYSDHVVGNGPAFFAQACGIGVEGIVSKRVDSRYVATRSRDWQKVKCSERQEFVIGGYTNPQGSRTGFGALLLGVYDGDALRYCGKVGTGFNDETLTSLTAKLERLETDKPPFVNPPKGAEARRAHWVRPLLVAEVSFTEWTRDATLRHPSFQGLREDKRARDVVRENAAPHANPPPAISDEPAPTSPSRARKGKARSTGKRATAAAKSEAKRSTSASDESGDHVAGVAISNPGKLLYPEAGVSKLDLARYYEAIGKLLVAQVRDRPLTIVRCPNGWDKPCFYQKHANRGVSAFVERIDIRDSGGVQPYMMANDVRAVVALLQMGVLEFHPWGSRAPDLDHPDRLIFDFDPDEALGYDKLVEAVTVLRKLLDTLELEAFLKTTGGKGMHVVIPIEPTRTWDDVKEFCRAVAEMIVKAFPDRYTSSMAKTRRPGRIFIDYLRNVQGATAVAAYSARAKRGAPVSMPIDWSELADDVRFDRFNVKNVPGILASRKRDPWARMPRVRQPLTDEMFARVGAKIASPRR